MKEENENKHFKCLSQVGSVPNLQWSMTPMTQHVNEIFLPNT